MESKMAEEKRRKSILDLIFELVELLNKYFKQQLLGVISESVVEPLTTAGRKVGFWILTFTLFAIASIFIAVAVFLILVQIIGSYSIAYLIVGVVFTIAGIVVGRKALR
jgi:membrane-bound ClpP family serine protease